MKLSKIPNSLTYNEFVEENKMDSDTPKQIIFLLIINTFLLTKPSM